MALQGVYQGLIGGMDMQMKQHQQLANDAIAKAQQQQSQDNLNQQKVAETNRQQNRIGDNFTALLGHLNALRDTGSTGAEAVTSVQNVLPVYGLDNDMAQNFLNSYAKLGQSQAFTDRHKAMADTDTRATATAQQKVLDERASQINDLTNKLYTAGNKWEDAYPAAVAQYDKNYPVQNAGASPSTGGVATVPGTPESHQQLANNAIATANAQHLSQSAASAQPPQTMTMPSGISAPTIGAMLGTIGSGSVLPASPPGIADPSHAPQNPPAAAGTVPQPALGISPPSPSVGMARDINAMGPPAPGAVAPAPPANTPIQIIPKGNMITGISPAFQMKEKRNEQLNVASQIASQYTQERLARLLIDNKYEDAWKQVQAEMAQSRLALVDAQAKKIVDTLPGLQQAMADKHLSMVTNDNLKQQKFAFYQSQVAWNNAVKTGAIISTDEKQKVIKNASNYIVLRTSMKGELTALNQSEAVARYWLDPKQNPPLDPSDPKFPAQQLAKQKAQAAVSPVFDPVTGVQADSPINERRTQLKQGLQDLEASNTINDKMMQDINHVVPDSNSGKPQPNKGRTAPNTFPSANAGQVAPNSNAAKLITKGTGGKVDYSKMSTGDIAIRMANKLKGMK